MNIELRVQQTPCGFLRLLLIMLYDSLIVFALLMITGAIALHLPFNGQSAGKDPAYTFYLLMAWFLYLAWCWRHAGMTLGMRAWKVQLINSNASAHDHPPSWWQCLLRFIGAWLSVVPAGMGYWWMLFDRQRLSWHDRLSKTRLLHITTVRVTQPLDDSPQEIDGDKGQ